VLQKNAGLYPLILPTLDPPVEVAPGGLLEHPVLLAGFEPASPDHDEEHPSAETDGASGALLVPPSLVPPADTADPQQPRDTPAAALNPQEA
jgi:hypothetical protein